MINDTLSRIEQTIATSETLSVERKQELLSLVTNLKDEIHGLGDSYRDEAGSIVRYAESSVNEAVREQQDSELLDHTLAGLTLSVKQFEISHPTLIGIINSIGQTLGNIGI